MNSKKKKKKKNSSQLSITKFNLLAIKRNCEDKTVEANRFRKSHSYQWKLFVLQETISILFCGNHSFYWKPFILETFFLEEVVPFNRSHSIQYKPVVLMEATPLEAIIYDVSHSFQWKLFLLREGISFTGSNTSLVEAIPFSGCSSLQ